MITVIIAVQVDLQAVQLFNVQIVNLEKKAHDE